MSYSEVILPTCNSWICSWYLCSEAWTAEMVLSAKAGEVGVRRALFGDLNMEKDDRMSEQITESVILKLCFMKLQKLSKGFQRIPLILE